MRRSVLLTTHPVDATLSHVACFPTLARIESCGEVTATAIVVRCISASRAVCGRVLLDHSDTERLKELA